jgi:hypothetical protein
VQYYWVILHQKPLLTQPRDAARKVGHLGLGAQSTMAHSLSWDKITRLLFSSAWAIVTIQSGVLCIVAYFMQSPSRWNDWAWEIRGVVDFFYYFLFTVPDCETCCTLTQGRQGRFNRQKSPHIVPFIPYGILSFNTLTILKEFDDTQILFGVP